jgi:quercetin dioxygenase-like cupin family protein
LLAAIAAAVLISSMAAASARAQDPLKVAPTMYKLLFENERVRVMEVTFKPGERIAPHAHPDHFVYVAAGGSLTITAGEKTMDAELKPGQVIWIAAESHWAVNNGKTDVRLVVTELKEPSRSDAPVPKSSN